MMTIDGLSSPLLVSVIMAIFNAHVFSRNKFTVECSVHGAVSVEKVIPS